MDIEKQKEMYIVKDRQLAGYFYKLTVDEQKIVLIYISMIRPYDDPNESKKISLKDYANLTGKEPKNVKKAMVSLQNSILSKPITIELDNGSILSANWFSSAIYDPYEQVVSINSDKNLKPFLFDIQRKYFGESKEIKDVSPLPIETIQYKLKNIVQLKGDYSISLFELLRPYGRGVTLKFKIDELKLKIGAYEGTHDGTNVKVKKYRYPKVNDFKKRVLDPAIEEINEKSDIYIGCIPLKKSRKIEMFKFVVSKNEGNPPLKTDPKLFDDSPGDLKIPEDSKANSRLKIKPAPATKKEIISEIPQELINKFPSEAHPGLRSILTEIIEAHGLEVLKLYVDYVAEQASKRDIPKLGGYFQKIFKANWHVTKLEEIKIEEAKYQKKIKLYRTYSFERLSQSNDKVAYAVLKERGRIDGPVEVKQPDQEEYKLIDKLIKNLEKDLAMQNKFIEYMVSRQDELDDFQKQSFQRQIKAGAQISIWVRRKFYNDFIISFESEDPGDNNVIGVISNDDSEEAYDEIHAGNQELLDAMDLIRSGPGESYTKEDVLRIIEQVRATK